ncbi:MAG TPA: hypothetical protein VJ302_05100 [Blastocatellia bacterium]|nr:hypothetical protein [Blastocatellia bacterium]
MSAKITVIVYILICFEVGILLVFLPWTPYWEDNVFLHLITGKLDAPWIRTLLISGYIKGAVSGLGALNILAGLRDILKFRESVQALIVLGDSQKEEAKPAVAESARQSSIALPDQRPPGAPPQA